MDNGEYEEMNENLENA